MAWTDVAPRVQALVGLGLVAYLALLAARSRREVGRSRCSCGAAWQGALAFCARCGVVRARG